MIERARTTCGRTEEESAVLSPEKHPVISTGTKEPWLCWMPCAVQHSEALMHSMANQSLHRHDHWTLQQVVRHVSVQDGHGGIIRGCRKQGISTLMECCSADSTVVILQSLIWRRPEVQVKPHQASVVRSNCKVFTAWVHGQGADPAGATEQRLHRLLRNQVIDADTPLSCDIEERLGRAKRAGLNVSSASLRLGEWMHGLLLLQGVHYASIGGCLGLWAHSCTVVSLHVPTKLLYVPICSNRQPGPCLVQD
mmetsp:Transcript_46422/g.85008  ORF Transcript_46422/g.85008 Transcript_46422/m.85008 type:complete len:252 (-) Transcript_46422:1585-2340(-)